MQFTEPYIPPTLTVDAVLFQIIDNQLHVFLTKRAKDPFKGDWALPGGYCPEGQTTTEALGSIVQRKVGINIDRDLKYIEQLYTFDTVARDPRGHAVSVTYMGSGYDIQASSGDQVTQWHPIDTLPQLAYDHHEIIAYARKRLGSKLSYTNVAMTLLGSKFTLTHLQSVYEAVLGHDIDKRNFRKKFLSLNLIHETSEMWRDGAHRPAKLYVFNNSSIEDLPNNIS